MASHSSILVYRISQTEESDGLQSMGLQRIRQDKRLSTLTFVYLKISSPVCTTVPISLQSCLCCLAVNIFLGAAYLQPLFGLGDDDYDRGDFLFRGCCVND